ncbi:MAG: DUF309 domain-containing protein [Anaerolineaceae bacterium]|jgi:hypothetical protein|nr:MAG: hypothetical protein CVU46_17440 [Chloroflexi bacterium HGW-Chloroflexi-8]
MPKSEFIRLHPRAIIGIEYFNQKRYFEAHEELEAAWKAEKGQIRELYRGILQIGVAYYHIQNQNYKGGKVMLERANKWLALFPDKILGINLQKLLIDSDMVYQTLLLLGPENIGDFNPILFQPVIFINPEKEN